MYILYIHTPYLLCVLYNCYIFRTIPLPVPSLAEHPGCRGEKRKGHSLGCAGKRMSWTLLERSIQYNTIQSRVEYTYTCCRHTLPSALCTLHKWAWYLRVTSNTQIQIQIQIQIPRVCMYTARCLLFTVYCLLCVREESGVEMSFGGEERGEVVQPDYRIPVPSTDVCTE